MVDHDWLREDLLCIGGNAIKYSRESAGMPVSLRVTIETSENTLPPIKQRTSANASANASVRASANAITSEVTPITPNSFQAHVQSSLSKEGVSSFRGIGVSTGADVGTGLSVSSTGHVRMLRFSMLDSGHAVDAEKLCRFFDRPAHTGTSNLLTQFYQHALSTHPINTPYQRILSILYQCASYHHILSIHPLTLPQLIL